MSHELDELISHAVRSYPRILGRVGVTEISVIDLDLASLVGKKLLRSFGSAFLLGRDIMTALSPDRCFLPPPNVAFADGPSSADAHGALMMHPWAVSYVQRGFNRPRWRLAGDVYCDGSHISVRQGFDLLHLDVGRTWARVQDRWIGLGQKAAS